VKAMKGSQVPSVQPSKARSEKNVGKRLKNLPLPKRNLRKSVHVEELAGEKLSMESLEDSDFSDVFATSDTIWKKKSGANKIRVASESVIGDSEPETDISEGVP